MGKCQNWEENLNGQNSMQTKRLLSFWHFFFFFLCRTYHHRLQVTKARRCMANQNVTKGHCTPAAVMPFLAYTSQNCKYRLPATFHTESGFNLYRKVLVKTTKGIPWCPHKGTIHWGQLMWVRGFILTNLMVAQIFQSILKWWTN